MTSERVRAVAPTILVVVGTAGAAFAAGAIGGHLGTTMFAVMLGVLVIAVLMFVRPASVGVVALIAIFNIYRVGATVNPGASAGVSYSDVALAGATIVALPAMLKTTELKRLTLPLVGLALYFAALLPTLFLNPSHRSLLEAGHRFVLVGGALVVGAWLARDGLVRPALRLLIVVALVVGVATIINGAEHGFSLPAAPFGLNKNYGGALQGDLAVIVLVLGNRLGLHPVIRFLATAVFVGATLAAHSRGSVLGICAALLLVLLAGGFAHSRGTRAFVVALALALGVFMYNSIQAQMDVPNAEFKLNSLGVRQAVEREVQHIWRTSPWDGVGLKYFNSGQYGSLGNQPANNVVDNELAESGLIGMGGFVLLIGCVGAAGWVRRKDQFVVAGLALVVGHIAHGQVDIYWQAGLVPLPYLVLGMGLGMPSDTPPTKQAVPA